MKQIAVLAIAVASLAACQKAPDASQSQTRITSVEVQPGTVSDDMIVLDTVADQGTAIDTKSTAPIYDNAAPSPSEESAAPTPRRAAPEAAAPAAEVKPGDTVVTPGA